MIVLGIESSCDEMAAAVVRDGEVLASVVHEQGRLHHQGIMDHFIAAVVPQPLYQDAPARGA